MKLCRCVVRAALKDRAMHRKHPQGRSQPGLSTGITQSWSLTTEN
jgi:hypothetical protein